jgi:PAS domain S-box-containing protein
MYNPIRSHLCLQLTQEGTIVNCYISNSDDIQPKQFLGGHINDLLPFTVARDFLQAIAQVIQTQNLTTLRYSLARSNQSDRAEQCYEVKLIPYMGDDPVSQENLALQNQVLAFISNITEQEQELTKLRNDNHNLETCLNDRTYALRLANEQLWETMSELQEAQAILEKQTQTKAVTMTAYAGRVGIWDWNLAENKIYIDPILKSLLGYRDEEISNDWNEWQAKIHPADIERIDTALSDYSLGINSQFELEYRMFHKDGSIRWFLSRGTAIKRKPANLNHLIGTNTDITETKIIQEALRDSEEWFRTIFNQAAIGIAQVSLYGNYLQVNQTLCDILGYKNKKLVGESFLNFLYKEDHENGKKYLKALVNEEITSYSLEQRYLRSNRQVVWTNVTASLVRDSASQAKYLIMVVQDISDRRKAEFALEYNESRYRAIVEDQTELVCRFFIDGTLTFVNHAYCHYFGKSYAQLIGNSYLTLLSDEERTLHQKT